MKLFFYLLLAGLIISFSTCHSSEENYSDNSFAQDLQFLQSHYNTVVLSDQENKARLVIIPELQARVMTSTAAGDDQPGFGWINYELISSGKTLEHFNPFGGEDRFWLGPEGGQFAVFFKKGDPFDLSHWYTPKAIDTEPFRIIDTHPKAASFATEMVIENYAGYKFDISIFRRISLLSSPEIQQYLDFSQIEDLNVVGFESLNTIRNKGKRQWDHQTGLLSVWILGMFKPSSATTIVVPFRQDISLDSGLNDSYFGKIPPDRLKIGERAIYFRGDGQQRGKIGLRPSAAYHVLGSYDEQSGSLTIVHYNQPDDEGLRYVNSVWELQEFPYKGDVVNAYNDGPPAAGADPLGPFYELETSSPAIALAPGDSVIHIHRTFHLQGNEALLDKVSRKVLHTPLSAIKAAF